MTVRLRTLAAIVTGSVLATNTVAQSAGDVRGLARYAAVQNEPAPALLLDPALPDQRAMGIFRIRYRGENVRRDVATGGANANHQVFTEQTVRFTVLDPAK